MPEFGNMNNQNGGASANAVSTTTLALFAGDSTMLRISFRNDTMFINIIPCITDPASGRRRWPREIGHTAALRAQHAAALWRAFEQTILKDIEKKEDHLGYVVVPLNRDNTALCGFSYAGGRCCFSIFNNVAADRTCKEISTFAFEPTPAISEYNPNTGSYNLIEVQGQLYVMVMAIKYFAELASNYCGHGAKNAMAYNHDVIMAHLQAMAEKLGATPSAFGSYRGNSGSAVNFQSGNSFTPSMGGYANDGPALSATANQPSLMQLPRDNEGVTWNTAEADSSALGHTPVTPVQQVSELSDLMN